MIDRVDNRRIKMILFPCNIKDLYDISFGLNVNRCLQLLILSIIYHLIPFSILILKIKEQELLKDRVITSGGSLQTRFNIFDISNEMLFALRVETLFSSRFDNKDITNSNWGQFYQKHKYIYRLFAQHHSVTKKIYSDFFAITLSLHTNVSA